jgi:hypothetical protein
MKLGRNDPCHCGSGKKYKKCCQEADEKLELSTMAVQKEQKQQKEEASSYNLLSNLYPLSVEDPDFSELTEEENALIDSWWLAYEELEAPEAVWKHITTFISKHPKLFPYLNLNEDVVFDLGQDFRLLGRFGEYVAFLEEYRRLAPDLYEEEEGYFNLEIISWLISTGNTNAIPSYLSPYVVDPILNADTYMDLVSLLSAKDVIPPLLELIEKTKPDVEEDDALLAEETIVAPLVYNALTHYLKADYTKEDVTAFAKKYAELYDIDYTDELVRNLSERFEDILRPFIRWETDPAWGFDEQENFYFSISDNFMRYLRDRFGLSWICAQFYSGLVFEYGLIYLDLLNGEKWDKVFDFSEKMLDQVALKISGGAYFIVDPVLTISFLNAVYYFVDYLSTCDMLDGMDQKAVKEITQSLYEVAIKSDSMSNSVAVCFSDFPLWKTK